MRRGVFVTGTDTGVGKTVVSACLVRRWQADYWKPAQTGLATEEADSPTVGRLAGAAPARLHPPRHALQAPLSPEAAARREGLEIGLGDFALPAGTAPIVVEGAGGVLVPLGSGTLMADLIRHLGLPALLVARSTLGTINHTLLSLEALRARALPVAGIVLVGPDPDENARTIERLGGIPILAKIPPLRPLDEAAIAAVCSLVPPLGECLAGCPGPGGGG
jgi:malonyl-CoA O-methyltransferase